MANGENVIKLIGLEGPYKENEYPVDKSEFTIGRGPDNDMVLNDPTVSASHAKLVLNEGRYEIVDLNSTNGTFVNDIKIARKPLRMGDIIRLDKIKFKYFNETEVDRTVISKIPEQQIDPTVVQQAKPPVAPPPAPTPPPQPQMAPNLPGGPAAAPQEPAMQQAVPPQPTPRPGVQPKKQTFENKGHFFVGLLLGLMIAMLLAFGGSLVINILMTDSRDFMDITKNHFMVYPCYHLHTFWLHIQNVAGVLFYCCLVFGVVLGNIIGQTISKRSRFLMAFVFTLFYVLIFAGLQFAFHGFNFSSFTRMHSMALFDLLENLPLGFGEMREWIGTLISLAYFGVVTFVLSFLGCLIGRK